MKIYLIRHGQTTGDVEDRYGGDYDDHLTEYGQQQAKILAKKLTSKGIEVIFTSPRIRARETSEILKDALGCEVKTMDDIRERNAYGDLTGMIKAEAKEKYPEDVEKFKDYHNAVIGAEEYVPFKVRIINAFSEIINSNFKTVAIVSHGGPIRCLAREYLGLGELKYLGDCAIIGLSYDGERFVLQSIDNANLEGSGGIISKYTKGRTAVFIDASNIYYSCKELGWKVDYKRLFNYFKINSNLVKVSFYSAFNPENEKERKFHDFLEINGYVVRRKKIKFIKDKNEKVFGGHHKGNIDVDLTIDAVHFRDTYETFILLSGDTDFESLVKYLKMYKKRCIVISTKGHVGLELIRQAKFIDFKKIRKEIEFRK